MNSRAGSRSASMLFLVFALLTGLLQGEVAAQSVGGASPPPIGDIPGLLGTPEGRPAAMEAIRARIAEVDGRRARLWIQLLAVAGRTGPEGGVLAAEAVLRADENEAGEAVELLARGIELVPEGDRPPLLGLAAHLADSDDPAGAAGFRERMLELAPTGTGTSEARLRLARYRMTEGDRAGAIALLEELIVNDPDHPVAPEARRLLRQIQGGALR